MRDSAQDRILEADGTAPSTAHRSRFTVSAGSDAADGRGESGARRGPAHRGRRRPRRGRPAVLGAAASRRGAGGVAAAGRGRSRRELPGRSGAHRPPVQRRRDRADRPRRPECDGHPARIRRAGAGVGSRGPAVCARADRGGARTSMDDAVEVLGCGDLTSAGLKFGGSAQRRLRNWFFVHCSILYDFPLDRISRYLELPDAPTGVSARAITRGLLEESRSAA